MNYHNSKFSVSTLSSLVLATGMMFLPGTAMAGQGMASPPVGSGSQDSVPDVRANTKSSLDTQWNDQLQQQYDQTKQSQDQAKQNKDSMQEETSNSQSGTDRAMSSIGSGSALDAVDRSMPVTPRR
ncbi:MAG: hypothetical protein KC592_03770 [Nitrospira sp.]|nr:hypothetical protein [Nitrospira sp.]HBP86793.1 hypothetical protein [Nitrospiraceae bacterium]HNP27795.1 hypothetical protein [Nitrospirales bacterium]